MMDPRWPSWTDSLACCAYLRDAAREAGLAVEFRRAGTLHIAHWTAFRDMTEMCRRFLSHVEEEAHARR